MGKKFKILTTISSNEVSLCSKYNSGANKQTEFELVKDKEGAKDSNMKPVIEEIVKYIDAYGETIIEQPQDELNAFKDFLNYWLEYDVNNCYYSLLSDALRSGLSQIQYREDITKEEKIEEYKNLFNMFIEEYKKLPITKTEDGKYEVSLVSKSHIKEVETNPQNETTDITKEKTSKMENEEKLSVLQKAFESIKSAFGLEKTETPADAQPEVKPEDENKEEVVEEGEATAEEVVVEETPVVEEVVEEVEATQEEVAEEIQEQVEEEIAEETIETQEELEAIAKTAEDIDVEALMKAKLDVEKELAELKKSNEEKEIAIEKMSFIQKAKDEYSMLVGTPEEIGEKLYSISKSNLCDEIKDFVLEQLKKVSDKNEGLTEELGSITKNAGDMTDEEKVYAQAEELAKSKNISIKKALREIR